MLEASQIAAALPADLREALIDERWSLVHIADQLEEMGLVESLPGYFCQLTDLGREVVACLRSKS